MTKPQTLLDGLRFPEGPRWHENRLWFSDMHAQQVIAVDLEGRAETITRVEGDPSGLGWTPDGRLLVVSMQDRRLLRLDPDGLSEVADLSAHATFGGLREVHGSRVVKSVAPASASCGSFRSNTVNSACSPGSASPRYPCPMIAPSRTTTAATFGVILPGSLAHFRARMTASSIACLSMGVFVGAGVGVEL